VGFGIQVVGDDGMLHEFGMTTVAGPSGWIKANQQQHGEKQVGLSTHP
jgi:hypothetical protein